MNAGFDRHFPVPVWEDYAMGMLSEQDSAPTEEHLLICPACRHLLAEVDEYVEILKAATALAALADNPDRPLITDFQTRRRLSKPVKAAALLAGGVLWLP